MESSDSSDIVILIQVIRQRMKMKKYWMRYRGSKMRRNGRPYVKLQEPYRTSSRSGNVFIQEILRGNETRCYENFRLRKSVFVDLSNDLTEKYGLKPTRGMSIHEMLGMFLMTCAHGAGNRLIQEIFQHSGETIHRHFHSVLKAVCQLARDIIRPHQNYNDGAGAHKPCTGRYLPFFRDCVGALDGTHVKSRLPQGQEIPYIGRKGAKPSDYPIATRMSSCCVAASLSSSAVASVR
ncbi:uncharacterized protein LOC142176255 [Nicotiana tabacum]|uniref:Uncharacterized protein LOC142176255 n=1 Tax=Nicotiana tabacum TaxID=4097 RepID=A0AC58TQH8_TOBAC